jgi:hypothetical protein
MDSRQTLAKGDQAPRWAAAAAMAVAVMAAWPAEAGFVLNLTAGSDSVSVTDNGAGDVDPAAGSIVFVEDNVFGNLSFLAVFAGSKPAIGSAGNPQMNLLVQLVAGDLARLVVDVTDTGFALNGPVTVTSTVKRENAVSETVQFVGATFLDNTDAEFGEGTDLSLFAFIDEGNFDLTDTVGATADGSFSLTGEYDAFFSEGFATYTATISATPAAVSVSEPATFALAASALLGFAWARRRA